MWDEFPDAIAAIARDEGPGAAENLLGLFRSVRQSDFAERIRWVLTGSIGFHHVLKQLQDKGGVNDMFPFQLEPLTQDWSRWLAECLLLGIGRAYEPAQAAALAEICDGIPYVLEMMVLQVKDRPESLPTDRIQARRLLLEAAASSSLGANWAPLLNRVDPYYGTLAPLAEYLLDQVARNPQQEQDLASPVEGSELTRDRRTIHSALDLLVEDRYLDYGLDSGAYTWRHPALRTIWQARRRGATW
jgi:hypothetical protein